MAQTTMATPQGGPVRARASGRAAGRLGFDLTVALLSCWLVGGACLDGWAHRHIAALESFFTPWHAVLYSGYAATALYLLYHWYRGYAPGTSWRGVLPAGYDLSLVGVAVFAVAGVGDMIWHLLFGIEANVDALLSPTHLALVTGAVLIVGGPLRAAWRRGQALGSWRERLSVLLSLTLVFTLLTFITQYAHPFVNTGLVDDSSFTFGDSSAYQALGVAGIVLQGAIVTGLVLTTMRGVALPFGGLTFVFTLNAALMTFMSDQFRLIPAAAVAGLLADLLLLYLRPSAQRPLSLRAFAFALPTLLYLIYFLDLAFTSGILWSIHSWLGSAVEAGFVGLGLSYLVIPPAGIAHGATQR